MKTSTENINALNDLAENPLNINNFKDLQPGNSLEFNFDPMSELGEWKDVEGYPNYQINNEGAFMNKRTLKMLKHFVHFHGHGPVVTLYRGGKGDVLSVEALLKDHFGSEAELPKVHYFTNTFTEIAPPKAKAKSKKPI